MNPALLYAVIYCFAAAADAILTADFIGREYHFPTSLGNVDIFF